jgi:hypothetical protein
LTLIFPRAHNRIIKAGPGREPSPAFRSLKIEIASLAGNAGIPKLEPSSAEGPKSALQALYYQTSSFKACGDKHLAENVL